MLEPVAFDLERATAGTRWALAHWRPDVLFHYTPMSDSAGHIYASEPEVGPGRPLPAIRHVDVAGWLARWLEIE